MGGEDGSGEMIMLCPGCLQPIVWSENWGGQFEHDDGSEICVWVVETPWRGRLRYNMLRQPFPFLFHRWSVYSTLGFCCGFFFRRNAERWIKDYELIVEIQREEYERGKDSMRSDDSGGPAK